MTEPVLGGWILVVPNYDHEHSLPHLDFKGVPLPGSVYQCGCAKYFQVYKSWAGKLKYREIISLPDVD